MVEAGMWSEIDEMKRCYDEVEGGVDMSKGIWQSIGFKEFLPLLGMWKEKHGEEEGEEGALEECRKRGIESMKTATRQYARTQVRWIRIKLLNALQSSDRIFLLDSTDPSAFGGAVTTLAVSIAKSFLSGDESSLPDPVTLSAFAAENLKPKREDFASRPDLWVQKTCELCGIVCINEYQWGIHEKSARHRRMVKKEKRSPEIEMYINANREDRARRMAGLVEVLEKRIEDLS
jgi:tRNA dimethylallyltransferase